MPLEALAGATYPPGRSPSTLFDDCAASNSRRSSGEASHASPYSRNRTNLFPRETPPCNVTCCADPSRNITPNDRLPRPELPPSTRASISSLGKTLVRNKFPTVNRSSKKTVRSYLTILYPAQASRTAPRPKTTLSGRDRDASNTSTAEEAAPPNITSRAAISTNQCSFNVRIGVSMLNTRSQSAGKHRRATQW